jgi:hypothetical protein
MFCEYCGDRLLKGDCGNCFNNANSLKEFEEEDE